MRRYYTSLQRFEILVFYNLFQTDRPLLTSEGNGQKRAQTESCGPKNGPKIVDGLTFDH